MKLKFLKPVICTMIAFLVFITSACTELTKKDADPVELHVMLPVLAHSDSAYATSLRQVYMDAAENFNSLHPHITVVIEQIQANGNTFDALKDRIKSDETLDIVPDYFSAEERKELLLDLLAMRKEIDIHDKILDYVTQDGSMYSLPYSMDAFVVLYNKKLFDQANVPYPSGDWTWEQFRDTSKMLQPVGGSTLPYMGPFIELLTASLGMDVLSPDGETTVGYLDSPVTTEVVQWLNAYYHDDEIKIKTNQRGYIGADYEFERSQQAMVLGSYFAYTFYTEQLGGSADDIGMAPLPHFASGKRVNHIFGIESFGIPKTSKHPDEAWAFINYLILTHNADSARLADFYLTTSPSVSEAVGQSKDPYKRMIEEELQYVVRSSSERNPYFNEAFRMVDMSDIFELLSVADRDIPDKLHEIAIKVDQEMERLRIEGEQQAENSEEQAEHKQE